jgi:Rps23 Pro-64 3,4-dihydroxylase Tpa1-like proline 4-hydroxylase
MFVNPFSLSATYITAGSVAVYENVWDKPDETINNILETIKDTSLNVRFFPSQTGADPKDTEEQSIRTSHGLSISKNANANETMVLVNNRCRDLISSAVKNYRDLFRIEEEIHDIEGYGLLRYSGGEHYGRHYDGGTESSRSISVLIYLNDDYEGGEIEFPNFNIKIKPKAGMLMLFPSNYAYAHIAHPVTSGTKYVIATWLRDR